MSIATRPRVAPPAILLVYAMLATGIVAAYRVAPILWLLTPVASWIVLRAAVLDARRRVTAAPAVDIPELPPLLRDRVSITFTQLPDGDARRLLLSVVNQARLLFGRGESRFDETAEGELRDHVASLVEACCTTATDLARLDQFIGGGATSTSPTAPGDLPTRALKARDLYRDRLTSAASALAEMYTANIEKGTPSTDRVAELTAEIREDAAARSAAVGEMKQLLEP